MLIAVDPGLHMCGVSLWDGDGRLLKACLVRTESEGWAGMARAVKATMGHPDDCRGVIELPQVYVKGKGDPNDLIHLAATAGAVTMTTTTSWKWVLPKEWKGQTPKPKTGEQYIIERRALKRLSPEELEKVELPKQLSLAHNVWDGVALGLWELGRMRG